MLESLSLIRMSVFFAAFVFFVVLEFYFPFRRDQKPHFRINLLLIGLAWFVSFPLSFAANKYGYMPSAAFGEGVTTFFPLIWKTFLGIVLLDFSIYWQHRLAHVWNWLWQLHKIHHSETVMTTTTGVRFHPLEIAVSLTFKLSVVYIFGISLESYLLYEMFLNFASMMSHANVVLPRGLESFLRFFWMTPQLHRIHHSVDLKEEQSNYGLTINIWDRIFGSYTSKSTEDICAQEVGTLGIKRVMTLRELIRFPFA